MPRWAPTASAIVLIQMLILTHREFASAKMSGQPSTLVAVSAFVMILNQ
jgi:hypothetical protein